MVDYVTRLSKETGYVVVWVLDRRRSSIESDKALRHDHNPDPGEFRQSRLAILSWYIDDLSIDDKVLNARHCDESWWRRFSNNDSSPIGGMFNELVHDLKGEK